MIPVSTPLALGYCIGHQLWLFSYGQWEWNAGPHDCTTSTLSTDPFPQPLDLGEIRESLIVGLLWAKEGDSTVMAKKHPTDAKPSHHNKHPLEMSLSGTASLRKTCGSTLDTCSSHTHMSCTPTSSTQRKPCGFYSFCLNPVGLCHQCLSGLAQLLSWKARDKLQFSST